MVPDSPRDRLKPSSKASDSSLPLLLPPRGVSFQVQKILDENTHRSSPFLTPNSDLFCLFFVCVCGMWAFSSCGTQMYLPHGMWEFSTHTRNQTSVPCTGRWIRNHWTTREVPCLASNKSFFAGFPASVNLFLIHATPQPAITSESKMAFSTLQPYCPTTGSLKPHDLTAFPQFP